MPSLFSFLPARKPGIPFSRTKAETLRPLRPSGSVIASTTAISPDRAVGAERLGAVQDPAAVHLARRRPESCRVGARAGLGQGPGGDLLARGERRHPALPLLGAAELVDVIGAERVVGRDADADRRIDLGELGHDQHVLEVAEAGAAVLLREDDAEEAEVGRLAHQLHRKALRLVDLVDDRIDLGERELDAPCHEWPAVLR